MRACLYLSVGLFLLLAWTYLDSLFGVGRAKGQMGCVHTLFYLGRKSVNPPPGDTANIT